MALLRSSLFPSRTHVRIAQVAVALATPIVAGHAAAQPTITNLGVLPSSGGPTFSEGFGISGNGLVATGESSGGGGFRWTAAGGMTSLGLLPGSTQTYNGAGINFDGSVIVGAASDPTASRRAYRWTAATGMQGLPFFPGGNQSSALATNADGSVSVGYSTGASGNGTAARWTVSGGIQSLGFLPTGNSSTAAGVSADGSVVVGFSNINIPGSGLAGRAFRWTAATGMQNLGLLPGGSYAAANGVSGDGSTVTGAAIGPDGVRAFRWTAETGMTSLGVLAGGTSSNGFGVSADGSAIVGFGNSALGDRATLWTPSLGLVDLNAYLPTLGVDLSGWTLNVANGISADGRSIVGSGVFNGEGRAFVVSNVPAPGAASVLAIGGLFATRRRRAARGC